MLGGELSAIATYPVYFENAPDDRASASPTSLIAEDKDTQFQVPQLNSAHFFIQSRSKKML